MHLRYIALCVRFR